MKIILGSQSRNRKKVLEQMGYIFTVMPADIDEKAIRFSDPVALTLALANAKADALLQRIHEDALLITSDQVVVCNGDILEKPADAHEALQYLKSYAKYPAQTVTSVAVTNTASRARVTGTDTATISFRPIPDDVIAAYIASKDTFLHAGGFDYRHSLLTPYVTRIEGEPESIIGLPKRLTAELLASVQQI